MYMRYKHLEKGTLQTFQPDNVKPGKIGKLSEIEKLKELKNNKHAQETRLRKCVMIHLL